MLFTQEQVFEVPLAYDSCDTSRLNEWEVCETHILAHHQKY